MDIKDFTITLSDPDGKFRFEKVIKVNMYAREGNRDIALSIPHTEKHEGGKNPKVYEGAGVSCRAHKDTVTYRILADINIKEDSLTDEVIDIKVNAFRSALRKIKSLKE
ncbi:MAG: hypothetical protein MJZ36_01360 [Bacteroidaceae bacterium]|nr:hypothetical protein [Bacteroidaceae bacterium]